MALYDEQRQRVASGAGFFAALDQSGGSSPKALAEYGVTDADYASDAEMFDLMHRMRSRVVRSTAFGGDRVLGAILFEQTMDREIAGQMSGDFLWEQKGIVPFVKVDQGLADEVDGAQLMKPLDGLDAVLSRAADLGIFGTKMRSVIHRADPAGIAAVADQQFAVAKQIAAAGLIPILEPEVDIGAEAKAEAETLLRDACLERLEAIGSDVPYVFKVSIPDVPDLYDPLLDSPKTLRVVCLSGGYERDEACARLARCERLIASFSRGLLQGLTAQQSDAEFDATLEQSIAEIYAAST